MNKPPKRDAYTRAVNEAALIQNLRETRDRLEAKRCVRCRQPLPSFKRRLCPLCRIMWDRERQYAQA